MDEKLEATSTPGQLTVMYVSNKLTQPGLQIKADTRSKAGYVYTGFALDQWKIAQNYFLKFFFRYTGILVPAFPYH